MRPPADPATNDHELPNGDVAYWRRLFYRWFVEYNPLYLISAALVLGGCLLCSSGMVGEDSLSGTVGIALVAELYAVSLVGGAALLTRIGMKRPAVMLALIFVLFQWDMTLHTETCAYLGAAGGWATAAWVAIFAGKVYALGWALRVRFARHVMAAAIVAALGLAIVPRLLPVVDARSAGALLAVWLYALGALYREGGITSVLELNSWGRTVLRRATHAAWILSGLLVSVHVFFWWRDHDIAVSSVLPLLALLVVRRVRSEGRAWVIVLSTLVVVAATTPGAFSVTALLVTAALCLRAFSQAYGPAERARAVAGGLFAFYLSAWTLRWSGGPWPIHELALDGTLTTMVLVTVWRVRAWSALASLAVTYLHFVVQARLVPPPRSHLEWGATAVALGFVLLAGSLAASYRLRARPAETPARE